MKIQLKTENWHLGVEDKIRNDGRKWKGHVDLPGFGDKHIDGYRPLMSKLPQEA